jgi:hypothetical protein
MAAFPDRRIADGAVYPRGGEAAMREIATPEKEKAASPRKNEETMRPEPKRNKLKR